MNIGDLVTWKLGNYDKSIPLEIGVVIERFVGGANQHKCLWVKFINGQHACREKTLCGIANLVLIKDMK